MDFGLVHGRERTFASMSQQHSRRSSGKFCTVPLRVLTQIQIPSANNTHASQFIFEHSIKFTCKEPGCSLARQPFSSPEGLRIHEQEAHGSRNPSQKAGRHDPTRFLCTSTGCGRSRPGNGFSNKWVLENHIRTIHGNLEL